MACGVSLILLRLRRDRNNRDMKKHNFLTAEAAIILCHVTRESNYDDCMTSKYGKRKHKETSDLTALAVLW